MVTYQTSYTGWRGSLVWSVGIALYPTLTRRQLTVLCLSFVTAAVVVPDRCWMGVGGGILCL